jgi:hypothetical protein
VTFRQPQSAAEAEKLGLANPHDMRGLFGLGGMVPQAAPEPFMWGAGGSRVTPEQVAQMRQMAQAEMADASSGAPVAHWLQGLNRSLGAITGGLQMRRADKADAQITADSDAVTQALLADPSRENVLGAIASGKLSKGGMTVAEILAEGFKPATPEADPEIIRLSAIAHDPTRPAFERKAAGDRVVALNDPLVNMPLPGGRAFVGPRSEVVPTLGGGGQSSGVPQTTVPPAEAVAELKADPSAAAEFDEMFGAGSAARVLGGPALAPGSFPGGR